MKSMLVLFALLFAGACTKSDDQGKEKDKVAAAPAKPAAPVDPAPPAAATDYVRVLASHANPKPDDPVTVEIPSFRVTKAAFDPAKVEGGTATVELDLASIVSGSAKRDGHLKSPDYLDVGAFAVATITIGNVKRTAKDQYTADAVVAIAGREKSLPITFEVLETLTDGIRVRGEHVFSRHDFAIGADQGAEDSVGDTQTIQLQLTLRNT